MTFERNRINTRVLNDLKERSTIGILFYVVLSIIVVVFDDFYLKNKLLSKYFVFSICIICCLRYLHIFFFKSIQSVNPKLNVIIFRSAVILTALIWGIAFALFMTLKDSFDIQLVMAMISAGLCSGGAITFLPDKNLSFLYSGLIVIPAGITMLILEENKLLGFMIFIFLVHLILVTKRGNKEYWSALENEFILREKTGILENISRTDVLTGLYNRRHFDDVLESEWKRASRDQKSFTMAIADIDHFKAINDSHGHLAGDEYLKFVADSFKTVFKRESDFVARYGGEEFVVLLPDTNSMQAFELMEKLRVRIEQGTVKYNQLEIRTTISFGVACVVPDFSNSSTSLIGKADEALYKAKMGGRNRIEVAA